MNEDTRQFVAFTVGPHHLAADISSVKEILKPVNITPLPAAPDFVAGVIDLRGAVIPVIDLRRRLSPEAGKHPGEGDKPAPSGAMERTRYVIAAIDRHIFALVVDEVTDVIRLHKDQVRAAPGMSGPSHPVTQVFHHDGTLHLVVDLSRLLTSEERLDLEDFAKSMDGIEEGEGNDR